MMTVRKAGLSFDAVMGRLKLAIGATTDAALYGELGMGSTTYANRKATGSIPFDPVISLCIAKSINIDWLLTGEGAEFKDGRSISAPAVLNKTLLSTILVELQRAWNAQYESKIPDLHLAKMGLFAGTIYNVLVYDTNEAVQLAKAREMAKRMAEASKLNDEASAVAGRQS